MKTKPSADDFMKIKKKCSYLSEVIMKNAGKIKTPPATKNLNTTSSTRK
jgi:hypothetical protein